MPLQTILSQLPDSPGIYLFYNAAQELIYVGKATSLRSRVRSYWRGQRSIRPIEELIHEVADIKWKLADSALEAIILESVYIKKFLPRYNVLGKDNKSWNYITISRATYPRVSTLRQHEYEGLKARVPSQYEKLTTGEYKKGEYKKIETLDNLQYIFGPYPGLNTEAAMKLLRRLFRFSNCRPFQVGGRHRPCLYFQMGQCYGVCAGVITPEDYRHKVIRPLAAFLSGKKKQVVKMLERDMYRASKNEQYEEAKRLRDQLKSLYRIRDIGLLNQQYFNDGLESLERVMNDNRQSLLNSSRNEKNGPAVSGERFRPLRLEGYDISNLGATEKVGSMVVSNETGPVYSAYRKFIIKTVVGQSDVDCLKEVITRRLRREDWPLPDLFLIDGGRPQVNTVSKIITNNRDQRIRIIPVVGVAKGPERKRNDFLVANNVAANLPHDSRGPNRWKDRRELLRWVERNRTLLIKLRDEAHRFAITFHRARRAKKMIRSLP